MNMRRLTLGIAALMTLAFTGSALASDNMPTRQASMRDALRGLSFDLGDERVTFDRRGRRDLELVSHTSRAAIVAELQQAYRTKRALPNGYKVKGWAHIIASDSYTFTLQNDAEATYVAEVMANGAGTRIKLWGSQYKFRPNRKPLSEIPRRYVRPSGATVVR
ncbi:MAG: hypothetical protein EP329_12660 [Deltaproteobacteria bacterium]|nr:MAG: hypothetical protein EP329_12660 [Deltaproteobacteria bacterium]